MHADSGHELDKAGIRAERVGHGVGAEIEKAIIALLVTAIQPAEGRTVFPEAHAVSGHVRSVDQPCTRMFKDER